MSLDKGSHVETVVLLSRKKPDSIISVQADVLPTIVNFFYHEEIKKSAKKGKNVHA